MSFDQDGYPTPSDMKAWNEAAAAAAVNQLTNARDLAGKWAGTMTALIGVFGSVVVLSGPSNLSDISARWVRVGIVLSTIAAAGCAVVSIVYGAKAAQGGKPVAHTNFDGMAM